MTAWLQLHPTIKKVLEISAKNAVNALLVNGGLYLHEPSMRNLHTREGWMRILWTAGIVIGSREFAYWSPKLLAWSEKLNGVQ